MSTYFYIDFAFFVVYMLIMTTSKPQILITLDETLLERIEDFRYNNRIPTRAESIRRLIEEALKKYEKKSKK
jgi:metal-responsive CopG/Arc/MetJ family transcriptional regulator